jgi:hypothetical protein
LNQEHRKPALRFPASQGGRVQTRRWTVIQWRLLVPGDGLV